MAINRVGFHLLILASIFATCRSDDNIVILPTCVYTMYVKTGSLPFQGTGSNISLSLYDAKGDGISIDNLVAWGGLMPSGHKYFQVGNIDIFSGRGSCLTEPVCKMNLTNKGDGFLPTWYCDYVSVTTTGLDKDCAKTRFKVQQWLVQPLIGTVIRDHCKKSEMHSSHLSSVV